MSPEHEDIESLLNKLTASTRSPQGRYTADESWELLEKRIPQPVNKTRRLWMISSVAASILLCIAGWFTYDYVRPASIETVSTLAQISTITLPDQTVVTLNRYSTLSYPARFKGETRNVSLKGEAYFEVKKDTDHPFIVQADTVRIQVLGTHFNVEAYPEDEKIRTTLLEGSVAVTAPGRKLVLSPNESAVYNRAEQKLLHEMTPESSNEIAWRDGHFLFDNLPLKDIARQLSHTFHVKINITDTTLQNYRIRAHFTEKENLKQMLDLLKGAGNFRYTQTNDTIFISSKNN